MLLGFSGESFCKDTNECDDENVCLFDQKCTNTDGSYYCACNEGYARDVPASQQAAANCIDVDECIENPCPDELLCRNSPGSYACYCAAGYEVSKNKCVGKG